MAFVEVNGAKFYYERQGQGQAVVLIAGYTCDGTAWMPVVEALASHYDVITIDNRAVGQTTDDGRALNAELMAQDTIEVIRALGLEKPHIVGSSMGGTIVQTIAAQFPNEIGKLAIVASVAKWRQAMLGGLGMLLKLRELDVDFDVIYHSMLPWVFGEDFLSSAEMVEGLKQLMLNNPHMQSYEDQARQFAVLEQFDGREQLHKITAPTWIAYGVEDVISLPYESQYLLEHIADARMEAFDCAHGIPVERSEAFSQALMQFLQE